MGSFAEGRATNQPDFEQSKPNRQQIGPTAKVNVQRGLTPQKQDLNRKMILETGKNDGQRPRTGFSNSEYESTITNVLVEDSQPRGEPRHQGQQEESNDEEGSGSGEEGEGDEYEEGEDEEDEKNPQAAIISVNAFATQQQILDPFGIRDGESYPATTSGGQDDDYDEVQETVNHVQLQNEQYQQNNRQRNTRPYTLPVPQSQPSRPVQSIPQQPAQFKFTQPNQARAAPQRTMVTRASSPVPRVVQNATRHLNPTPPLTQPAQRPNTAGKSMGPPKPPPQSGFVSKTRPHVAVQVSPPERYGQEPSSEELDELEQFEQQQQQYDYDTEAIEKMQYSELHNQDFDDNPVKEASVLSEEDNAKPLERRLEVVQTMPEDNQRAFLSSLGLDDWEQAGDWFLERFGDVMKKMKDARKERRELAKGYEEEISKRHETVEGKKRSLENAMGEMSKNGAGVLRASTPAAKRLRM